ncbi:hypothetical protein ACRWFL_24015, partial [Escherichia coli]
FELLLCHGTVCVVGKMRDLILQLSKSSIYSTKPLPVLSSVDHPFSTTGRVNASTSPPDILFERFQRKAHQQTLLRLWVFSDRIVITIDPHFNRLRSLTT